MKTVLHLVSDSTGETVTKAASAVLALYADEDIDRRTHVFVRNEAEVNRVAKEIFAAPGPVLITMLNADLRDRITAAAAEAGVEAVPILRPAIEALERAFDRPPSLRPGAQYEVDDLYYRRVDAIDFAISTDDGATSDRFHKADVILTGVSRTSKTPTCIYLACRGVKAANMPLVPGAEPPESFHRAVETGVPVVALTASPNRLTQIRSHRLEAIGHDRGGDYAELDEIRKEVADARLFFERIGAPVIDVTRRSIEETAAAIMAILRERGRG